MDDWSAYRSFLGVLRTGSLSAAARELALSQPTLGRHIAGLEAELGTALFTRSVRGLAPTDAALAIRPHAEAIEAAAVAARRVTSAPAESLSGVVRVTTSEIVGAEVLPPMLAELRERHPGLKFEISLSNRTEDLTRRDADIAVRMVKPTQSALIAARIGKVTIGLFGRRDYLARHGSPARLSDLPRHTLIGFDRETPFLAATKRELRLEREMFALRCDSDLANLAALRAGCGLSICQLPLARRTPDLVRLLKDEVAFPLEIWIVMHEDLRRLHRMRATFDHLVASMKAYVRG